mmetsp:Transcript_324/g.630  ORF Transcript_324/g.630 Transcript_324/m.630 type:complete len:164 (-) Transcript_324:152-643(-)
MNSVLVVNQVIADLLKTFHGDNLNEHVLKIARIPEGSKLLRKEGVAWPLVTFRNVYIFPGPPALLEEKFKLFRDQFASSPFFTYKIFSSAPEALIAGHLMEWSNRFSETLRLGSYPVSHELNGLKLRTLLTLESKDKEALKHGSDALLMLLPKEAVISHHLET